MFASVSPGTTRRSGRCATPRPRGGGPGRKGPGGTAGVTDCRAVNPKHAVIFDRKFGRWFYPLHRRIYQLTGGLIGHHSATGPILLLTTTGRRTGQRRTTPLLYMPDGDDFVVVGSNGGRDRPPAWLLNVEALPQAAIQVGRKKIAVEAEVLRGGAREAIWPRLFQHYQGWDYYRQLTDREIPVVRLRITA
jgi:F420H(2)-dependent quinone reductase